MRFDPRDPFSEVVTEQRRWTPDWYTWLIELTEFINPQPVTVANLPSAVTVGPGIRRFVTDATATSFMTVVAGGGSNKVPVVSDGTVWRIG